MLTITPFNRAHFSLLASWFTTEREVVQWGGPSFYFPLDDDQLLSGCSEPDVQKSWMAAYEGQYIGHIRLKFDWRNGNAGIERVAVAPAARGRGFAAPMVSRILNEAFAHPEIERVELNVYSFNMLALRTYEKLGFVREGVRRSSTRLALERWDTVIMAMLRSEWIVDAAPICQLS